MFHQLSVGKSTDCFAGSLAAGLKTPLIDTGLVSHPSVMLTGHKQNTQTLTSVGAILNTRRECSANTPRRTEGAIYGGTGATRAELSSFYFFTKVAE